MTPVLELTAEQAHAAILVDELDLEPITFKLMHPEPGQTVMTLAAADGLVADYRRFLKLCAWYPGESIVPSKEIDRVWHEHILDTAKYASDSERVFGFFAHHFPYFGLRGPEDETAWHASFDRTRALFLSHFGIDLSGKAEPSCHVNGASCTDGARICVFDDSISCEKSPVSALDQPRPRPDRTLAIR